MHWKIKGLIQLFLSKIPYGHKINHKLQILRGSYKDEKLLNSVLVQSEQIKDFNKRKSIGKKSILEFGTGWHLIGVILFYLKGAEKIYGFDICYNFSFKMAKKLLKVIYNNLDLVSDALGVKYELLKDRCEKIINPNKEKIFLKNLNFEYFAPGDVKKTKLKSNSIDIIFSYGVIEHIPTKDFVEILQETKRIMKKDGRHYHNIGTHDHFGNAGLGNGVNFLRYPSWYWFLMTGNSFSYHNRLRISDYQRIFKNLAFKVEYEDKELLSNNLQILETLPINIMFQGYSKEDLAASAYYVDLTK